MSNHINGKYSQTNWETPIKQMLDRHPDRIERMLSLCAERMEVWRKRQKTKNDAKLRLAVDAALALPAHCRYSTDNPQHRTNVRIVTFGLNINSNSRGLSPLHQNLAETNELSTKQHPEEAASHYKILEN